MNSWSILSVGWSFNWSRWSTVVHKFSYIAENNFTNILVFDIIGTIAFVGSVQFGDHCIEWAFVNHGKLWDKVGSCGKLEWWDCESLINSLHHFDKSALIDLRVHFETAVTQFTLELSSIDFLIGICGWCEHIGNGNGCFTTRHIAGISIIINVFNNGLAWSKVVAWQHSADCW